MEYITPMSKESTPTASSKKMFIDGLPISSETAGEVLREIERGISAQDKNQYISITNTESMYHGLRDRRHGEYIKNARFSLCDGVGVIWAGWAWGHQIQRLNGPVLQLLASDYGQQRKWRHFYYGGKQGVAEQMAARLKEKFPELIVCGTYCPPFGKLSDADSNKGLEAIRAAKPDIVWVGLGLLKQERWISENIAKINAPWMVGVGAAFDYHSGAIPWAPAPVRALGLEWLFRLMLQPRLRARRYWWSLVYVFSASAKGVLTLQFLKTKSQ